MLRAHAPWTLLRALTVALALGTFGPRAGMCDDVEWTASFDMQTVPGLGGWFGEDTSSSVEDGVLHIVDDSSERGSGHCFQVEWEADREQESIVEASLKVVSAEGSAGVCFWLSDGVHEEGVNFSPEGIDLVFAEVTYEMDTTDDFHLYRVTIAGDDLKLWADDELVIDASGLFTHEANKGRNQLSFGSASSNAKGESLWDHLSFRSALVVQTATPPPGLQLVDIFREDDTYAVFPSVRMDETTGRLSTGFRAGGPRSHINSEGAGHVSMVSDDGGLSWERGPMIPGKPFNGPDGRLIGIGCKWWQEFPDDQRDDLKEQGYQVHDVRPGVVAICAGAYRTWSDDGGKSWQREDIELPFTAMLASGMNSLQLEDGTIVYPVYGAKAADDHDSSWVLRSTDYGVTWEMIEVGSHPNLHLNEPTIMQMASRRLLIIMRTGMGSDHFWQAISDDGGASWHGLRDTGVKGHPADLLRLADGRVLLTYGHRHTPLGVRAVVSHDEGETWDLDHIWALREGGGSNDLGYPHSVQLADGTVVTVYYFVEPHGMQFIACSRWQVPVIPADGQ